MIESIRDPTASGSRTSQTRCVVPGTGCTSAREQVTTSAPAASRASVTPRPIPRVPPVTKATRPPRSIVSAMLLRYQASVRFVTRGPMGTTSELRPDGIRVVTMDHPPVNALTVQGWFDLASTLDEAGQDPSTHVVVLRAEGRGFNAGVDIKEMQQT